MLKKSNAKEDYTKLALKLEDLREEKNKIMKAIVLYLLLKHFNMWVEL